MPLAWRMVMDRHAGTAFSGDGFRFGGRWNSPRTRVVYASATHSLAALETLVHLNPPMPVGYVVFRLEFADSLVETIPLDSLPPDWRSEPPGKASMAIGDAWVRQSPSAVLAVPNAIIPAESSYLLNPAHPDFASIAIGAPEPFAFDPRLL